MCSIRIHVPTCCRRCHLCIKRFAIPRLYDVGVYRGIVAPITHAVPGQTTSQTVFTDVFRHVIFTFIPFLALSYPGNNTIHRCTHLQTVLQHYVEYTRRPDYGRCSAIRVMRKSIYDSRTIWVFLSQRQAHTNTISTCIN